MSLPLVAAQWIGRQLPNRSAEWIPQEIPQASRGLDMLTVKELKLLSELLESKTSFNRQTHRRPPSSAKKSQRIEFLRASFYDDIRCTVVNTDLLDELVREMGQTDRKRSCHQMSTSSSSASYASAQTGSKQAAITQAMLNPLHCPHTMYGVAMNTQDSFSAASNLWSGIPMATLPSNLPVPQKGTKPLSTSSLNQGSSPNCGTPKSSISTANTGKPEQQHSEKAETPDEHRLLTELMQMGFQDTLEVLNGIRNQPTPLAAVTSDQVMLWIVGQREEAEEAKKMDLARLESEKSQKEQQEMQRKTANKKLMSAKTVPEVSSLFPGSWILSQDHDHLQFILESEARVDLEKLVSLEQKAQKWYGDLSRPFFLDQREQLAKESISGCKDWITNLCEQLQSAMFALGEQQGGVPKLFLKSNEEMLSGVDKIDYEGVDVVLVRPTQSASQLLRSEQNSTSSSVIEIE